MSIFKLHTMSDDTLAYFWIQACVCVHLNPPGFTDVAMQIWQELESRFTRNHHANLY